MSTLTQPAPTHRTPLPVRRALLAVAGVLAFALVAMAAYNLLDLAARHTTTERASYGDVRALVVDDASGIRLTAAPAGAPLHVVARVTEGLTSPKRSAVRGSDGTLRLSSSCPFIFEDQCEVSYEIQVPSGTLVRARSSAGDVVAEDLIASRPVELHSSAGDVIAVDVSAPAIQLSTGAGDVQARGLRSDRVQAESSAGDVVVSMRSPARRLLADSSAGDVDVLVPDRAYRLDATSSAGDVDAVELRTDPGSDRSITAHSSAGDVHVAAQR